MPFFANVIIAISSILLYSYMIPPLFFIPPHVQTRLAKFLNLGPGPPAALYALGISLTANHGTVSIRYKDGSFEDVGRVKGDKAYLKLMRRLSLRYSQHPSPPPYGDLDDMWNDQLRQFWRKVRRAVGLAASPDVAVLCRMLKKLIKLGELVEPSPSTVISYPALHALYYEDIEDAANYLKLRTLPGNHWHPPHEITAAYAGHGMGLCEDFNDQETCRKQGLELPLRLILLLEFTETALLLQIKHMREADDSGSHDLDIATSFEVGNAEPSSRNSSGAVIRDLVVPLLRREHDRSVLPPETIAVIVTGSPSRIENPDIQQLIKDAVEEVYLQADMFTSNPDFIAARGAAELAWRALVSKASPGALDSES
ncbi:hypothetical protein BDV95DRAFT_591851 [Massariosphaeria phaeospora]|uniref:Uncharacterized protein n=1 Tax=Massariosphaeria phaeospora TaxID=100035 RepID=A0A7C8MEQ5_9PLEO|nr:hypothetical protein BDV95DRAFT_591851 [Massariosphaeria phaeospora]